VEPYHKSTNLLPTSLAIYQQFIPLKATATST